MSRRRSRRRADERGVALIEIAIISPVIFALLLGILEFGLVFRDQLTAQDAVADAARIGAIVGPDNIGTPPRTGDYAIMDTLRQGMASIPVSWIERVVIFEASPAGAGDPEDQVPLRCRNGTPVSAGGARCNVYNDVQTAFERVQSADYGYFDCDTTPASPACSWDPEIRDEGPSPATIDYLGVWIRLDRDAITGIFGDDFRIERAAIVRLEPGATE